MALKKYSQIMLVDLYSDLSGLTPDTGQFAYALDVKASFIFDGISWNPSNKVQVMKSAVVVNGKSTGTTLVFTLPAFLLNFYPTQVIFRAVNVGGVTTAPTVSVGTNSSSYNNIVSASLLSTVLATLGATAGAPQNASISLPLAGGLQIFANVSIAALATNYTFNVEVIGFYDV